MSTTIITIEEVLSVEPHPNADRLDVIKVLGYQVITGKGNVKVGDHVFYFPQDIMIPLKHSEPLGVTQYLKHSRMAGDTIKQPCRVSSCRLRGLPSYGFVAGANCSPVPMEAYCLGQDVTDWFDGEKYEPPVRLGGGDMEPDMPNFHRYSNIENIQRCEGLISIGTQVVITEKIHGTNCRMGRVRDWKEENAPFTFQAGSNKVRRKKGEGLYWSFFSDNIKKMLVSLGEVDAVLFGEIYGPGVQDMQYGETEKKFRAFDLSIDGSYMDYDDFLTICENHGIDTVPELYVGSYSQEVVEEYTDGLSTFPVTGKFKGREGIVVKPIPEDLDYLGNRVIVKSVSVDYLSRRGAEDNE